VKEAITNIFKLRIFATTPDHDKPVTRPQANDHHHGFKVKISREKRGPAKPASAKNKWHNKAESRYGKQYQPAIVKSYFAISAPHIVKI
jgi:hypothetical protein